MKILNKFINSLPKLKTPIQLAGFTLIIGSYYGINSISPGNLKAQIAAGIIGIAMIIFGQIPTILNSLPKKDRSKFLERIIIIFCLSLITLSMATIYFVIDVNSKQDNTKDNNNIPVNQYKDNEDIEIEKQPSDRKDNRVPKKNIDYKSKDNTNKLNKPTEKINKSINNRIEVFQKNKYIIAGNVNYFKKADDDSEKPVPQVIITLEGENYIYTTLTNSSGHYIFTDVPENKYTISASKKEYDLKGIDYYDTSLISQKSVKSKELDCFEMISADVTCNGTVTSSDAGSILSLLLGANKCLNELCIFWKFLPDTDNICIKDPFYYITYKEITLNKDSIDENFIGVKLGDVSGDWH